MKIYSMTATFGKLEHETLTLQPGLNIIEAPNEWGKSTWCAFLVNMLYGMDTKARTTKTELADKERYAPWSGAPMAGRIDLNWNGRDITIERHTKGRLIFGEFRAYETASGIDIPELNAANCGSTLLGVERSVFTRSGFLKLTDLPVTQDDALRRRLNNLVTTGDESGAGDKLQKTLKDLKNKCRYNRSGLLPQAESQRDLLHAQLDELQDLQQQSQQISRRIQELERHIAALENHKAALRYEAAKADTEKVHAAEKAQQDAQAVYDGLQKTCDGFPSVTETQEAIRKGNDLQQQFLSLQMEAQMLPPLPQKPETPAHMQNTEPAEAESAAQADLDALAALETKKKRKNIALAVVYSICALALIAIAVARLAFHVDAPIVFLSAGIALLVTSVGTAIWSICFTTRWRKQVEALYDKHPGRNAGLWLSDAAEFAAAHRAYEEAHRDALTLRCGLEQRQAVLNQQIAEFTKGESLPQCLDKWQQILWSLDALSDATRDLKHAQNHAATLRSMVRTVEPPKYPDNLSYTETETEGLLNSARFELRQQQQKLGQYQGRAEALGQEAPLRTRLNAVNRRIAQLEDTYAALEIAQTALSAATTELQRRFAPRISKRAQELFNKLTLNRYDRLTLSEDLSLNVCSRDEDTLRSSQWRSDGTVDQLYLALRLAVAEELTPDAPLILDDALVRFDDKRLAVALDILRQFGENKQVILFTCQGRENKL